MRLCIDFSRFSSSKSIDFWFKFRHVLQKSKENAKLQKSRSRQDETPFFKVSNVEKNAKNPPQKTIRDKGAKKHV